MIDITFDALRQTGNQPHWVGLGFVCLKINNKQKMQFWHPDYRPLMDDVHHNRYSFSARIISGELIHETWDYAEQVDGKTECLEFIEDGGQRHVSNGSSKMNGRYSFTKDSKYFLASTQYHRTFAKRAVTILCRGELERDNILFLRTIGQPVVSPFLESKSEDECWEIIRELLA